MPSKKKRLIVIVVIFFILVIINSDRILNLRANEKTETITIFDKTFNLEIADEPREREKGLSGRPSLAESTGLLFVFDQPGRYGFWMKEMNFPIDIVWLDKNKKVLGLTKNLQPDSYPQIFYSPTNTSYVLEINTGLIN